MRSARSGTSSPGMGRPIQTSPPGPCSRHSSLHTTGIESGIAAESIPLASPRMEAPGPRGPRLRELGLRIGAFDPGPGHAITGVTVGHVTTWRDEPDPPDGRGIARTGVTAILPGAGGAALDPALQAGVAVLNGAGELTGSLQVAEWGAIETPVFLTSTMAVGR